MREVAPPVGRPLFAVATGLLVLALCFRLFGVVFPQTALDGEMRLARGVKEKIYDEHRLGARFYMHVQEARPLYALGLSPARAAYIEAALFGVCALLFGALALARLFGRRAGAAFLLLGALSSIDCNYAVHINGLSHAGMFIALALLVFTSRQKRWWAAGAVCLALGFVHRYHVGLVIVALVAGTIWHDLSWARREGWRRLPRLLLQRAWVAAIALAVLVAYEAWVSHVFHINHFERLISHENLSGAKLSGTIVHSNWHWLYIVLRLDPVVWVIVGAAVVISLTGERTFWRESMARVDTDRFVTAGLLVRWVICLVVALCAARTLSGMVRQIYPPLFVMLFIGAAVVAHVWERIGHTRLARAGLVLVPAVGLVVLGLAADSWYPAKARRAKGKAIAARVTSMFPGHKVERMIYGGDFLWSEKGYGRVRAHKRAPDFIVGGDRALPFIRLEEEPAKLQEIEKRIARYRVGAWIRPADLIYTLVYYVEPPLTGAEKTRLRDSLPLGLRASAVFPRGSSVSNR